MALASTQMMTVSVNGVAVMATVLRRRVPQYLAPAEEMEHGVLLVQAWTGMMACANLAAATDFAPRPVLAQPME